MFNKKLQLLLISATLLCFSTTAQVITNEDSLAAGLKSDSRTTVISGYGEAAYVNDLHKKTATANLTRGVVFLGHKFSERISFFSEIEIEDAKVSGGEKGGEVSFEQAFIKFGLSRSTYITAGLFVPRIGIINENHLPTTFNTVFRPQLETKLIPATWRELGVCLYGTVDAVQGLNYSIGVMNGLNSKDFTSTNGIREGRYEGRNASANNIAITASLLYYWGHFRMQASGYMGGTVGETRKIADSLGLKSGLFGTPFILGEANIQYHNKGFYAKGLATITSLSDASKLNAAYAENVAQRMQGYYVEAGYNLLEKTKFAEKQLFAFSRYENFDMHAQVPVNGIKDESLNQQYVFVGLSFKPTAGTIVKGEYQYNIIGIPSNPAADFVSKRGYVNIGIGYSF